MTEREITYVDPAGRRVQSSVWADGPYPSTRWVVPLDGGPRRTVLVRKVREKWQIDERANA